MTEQSVPEYSAEKYTWFRPQGMEEISDWDKISTAFPVDELDDLAQSLNEKATTEQANVGDYTLVMLQHDIIVAANKAYTSRYKSKLRHFAHADGVADRFGSEYGTFHYRYDMAAVNTKYQAASARK